MLRGGVFVGDGHDETVLTIEPGCKIYGESATNGMLVVACRLKSWLTAQQAIPLSCPAIRSPEAVDVPTGAGLSSTDWSPLTPQIPPGARAQQVTTAVPIPTITQVFSAISVWNLNDILTHTVVTPSNDGFFDTTVDFIGGIDPDNGWTQGWTTNDPSQRSFIFSLLPPEQSGGFLSLSISKKPC